MVSTTTIYCTWNLNTTVFTNIKATMNKTLNYDIVFLGYFSIPITI